jgi:hypothetical protein
MPLTRTDLKARYELFDKFALKDQKNYYQVTVGRYRAASSQVNRLRAGLAFMTGFSAAAAGLLVQSGTAQLEWLIGIFTVAAIVLPAFGALFSMLADLYQWDRLITIYDAARENIEVADAQSPEDVIADDIMYRAALMAYAEGTLSVMSDETAQWGQAIRTPAQLEKYLDDARIRAERVAKMQEGGFLSGSGESSPPST